MIEWIKNKIFNYGDSMSNQTIRIDGKCSRKIDSIVFHCSASDNPRHDDVSVMKDWHLKRGWVDVGYHFFIKKDGTIQHGRNINKVGAHVEGHNTGTVGVCFHGLNNFTKQQMTSIHDVITAIEKFVGKKLKLTSHRDYTSSKTCPNFILSDFLIGKLTIVKKYPAMADLFGSENDMQEEICGAKELND